MVTYDKRPPMPSVKSKHAPLAYHHCKIYHSMPQEKWRVLPVGEKVDKAFNYSHDLKGTWTKVLKECEKH